MATRIGKALVVTSTAALVGTFCVWTLASRVPRSQHVRLGPGLYASARGGGFDRQLLLFDDPQNGPQHDINAYHAIDVSRPLPGITIWSSSGGVMAHPGWWAAYVSLLYPAALFALPPAVWLLRRRRRWGRGFPVRGESATG